MVMISVAGEARTPSYHSMGSPRYGGCVSALLHFFDWNPTKRFSSTKRLPANKPEKAMRRTRSFCSDHGSAPNTRMLQICDAQGQGDATASKGVTVVDHAPEIHGEDASTRAPGVVARLMGLESLPDAPYQPPPSHRRSQSYTGAGELSFAYMNVDTRDDSDGTPVLLQDLLKRDFKSSRRTLRDRMPGFAKRAQEQYENRFTKKGAALTALRCRQEEAVSAYIDIPDVQRSTNQKAKDRKPPFLSRLAPSTSQRASPLLPSKLHTPRESPSAMSLEGSGKKIPELSLQQAGWPLAGQRKQRAREIDHESHEVSFRSEQSSLLKSERSTECVSSKPALVMSNGSKLLQAGRRKGSSWSGSEESDSTNDQQVEDFRGPLPVRNSHRNKPRVGSESTLKKASSSDQHLLRKSASSNVGNHEASIREFKTSGTRSPVISPKLTAQSIRTSSTAKAILSSKVELADQRQPLIQSRSRRSTDRSQSPVPRESSAQENPRTSSASQESTSTASQSSNLTANAALVPISKPSGKALKTGRAGRPGPKFTRNPQTNIKSDAVSNTMAAKIMSKPAPHGKPPPLDGYRALKVRNPEVGQRDNSAVVSGSRVFPSAGSPSRATLVQSGSSGSFLGYGRLLGEQKEGDKPVVRKKKLGEQVGDAAEMKIMRASKLGQSTSPTLSKQSTKNTLEGIQRVREKMLADTTPTPVQALIGDRLKRGNLEDMATQNSCGIIPKDARARSVDEVFPELPFDFGHSNAFTSSICETDTPISDGQTQGSASLSRSIERMFGQGFADADYFTDCLNEGGVARGRFASSPLIGCDEANPPADDLSWVDEIVKQRVSSPLCGRYCERSCSGPSISSVSVDASDVDDERNGDAWSSCASYNPADCDSPRTFELPDTDADSDLPEQKLAPTFVKRISEESDTTGTEVDEAGQPSPVSILNSPFHDEACTTSESSLTDSHQQRNSAEDGFKSTTKYNNNDKVRQALLDISMFQSLEVFTFEYKERTPSDPKEEQGFVREILSAAHFLSTPGSSPNWFNRDLAFDPSLFDRLESGDMDHAENGPAGSVKKLFQISGGLWRCDRRLLFDCVNEAFALVLLRYRGSEMGLLQRFGPRPRGQKLVEEVYKKIEEWRKLASYAIDFLIERDMKIHFGSWKNFSAEVAEVGLDIESMLWKAIIEEAVVDILSTSKHR